MRTNIVLDDRLVKEVMRMSKTRTKREAVDLALREFVSRGRQKDVLALIGAGAIAADYDVRAVRERMTGDPG
jgi:Arc/MetJ family transcription regulator